MPDDPAHPDGYRAVPLGGARVRADIVDVYVVRPGKSGSEFLQLLRASEPLKNSWHPIMGHIEAGESAVQTALRELHEEAGLRADHPAFQGLWALEQVHPYYVAAIDCIVLSPRFVACMSAGWEPTLNREHSAARWAVDPDAFMWPGQRSAAHEARAIIENPDSPAHHALRVR